MHTPKSVRRASFSSILLLASFVSAAVAGAACITRDPNVDTGNEITSPTVSTGTTPTTEPTSPTPAPGTVTVAYNEDIAPILRADCQRCHGGSRPDAGYSVDTYALTLREVRIGDARSRLVTSTQSRGSMYRYWSGNAAAKAELVRKWVVENGAAQSR